MNTTIICGIDEAGRGPLAGPVYAGSVILGDNFPKEYLAALNDSKKIKESTRIELRQIIIDNAFAWGIGSCTHTEIDQINILQATLLAMKRAFEDMFDKKKSLFLDPPLQKLSVIIDGNHCPNLILPTHCGGSESEIEITAMKKADAQVQEVMAASILAKTFRDDYMYEMAKKFPQYGYDKHKGYPTKAHRDLVLKHGPSPIQRLSFRVVSPL